MSGGLGIPEDRLLGVKAQAEPTERDSPASGPAAHLPSRHTARAAAAVLPGYLMYRSGLVPRRMAMLGLISGPLILASATAVLFGAYEQTFGTHFVFSVPEIAWEASLGIYLIAKGFKPSPIQLLNSSASQSGRNVRAALSDAHHPRQLSGHPDYGAFGRLANEAAMGHVRSQCLPPVVRCDARSHRDGR